MRTIADSFKRQKLLVRALIAITVLAGVMLFAMGTSEDEVRLRETGVMLSIVLPVIGLLEDRIYRKSRERYLETKAAAERQKLGLPPVPAQAPAQQHPVTPLPFRPAPDVSSQPLPLARPVPAHAAHAKSDADAIDWYGLYG